MSYTCKICGEDFDRKVDLMNHAKSNHKEEKKKEKEQLNREESGDEKRYREQPVYKSTDPRDIMEDVIHSPIINLNKGQIKELKDIAEDYEGVLSPAMLERLVTNFDGVNEKKAKYIGERYLIKLEKARDRLSIADAERLGLDLDLKGHNREGSEIDLEERIAEGIRKGFGSFERRLNMGDDVFMEPIKKILTNAAEATGITSRIINIFFMGIEGQVRQDPFLIGNVKDIMPQFSNLLNASQREIEEDIGNKEEKGIEIGEGKRSDNKEVNSRRKSEGIYSDLDAFFEEEEGDEE